MAKSSKQSSKIYPVIDAFAEARIEFCSQYSSPSEAIKDIDGMIGKTNIRRLFSDAENHEFSYKIQNIVIGFCVNHTSKSVQGWISHKTNYINQESYRSLLGNYKYWRYFPTDKNQTIYKIRVGSIVIIEETNRFLSFRHRSANAPLSGEWEDEGFVHVFGDRLYMTGFRKHNIRLAIAHIPDSLSDDHLHGIVLSTQSKTKKIFAAGFALFHETHVNYALNEIDDYNKIEQEFSTLGVCEPYLNQRLMID